MAFVLCSCAHSEPSDLELSYLFYLNGNHVVMVKNNASCATQARVNWKRGGLLKDTLVDVAFNSNAIIHLPGEFRAGSEIKAKSEGLCPNNGWTRITVPQTLEVKIVSFNATRKSGTAVIEYELYFEESTDFCILEKSIDGRTWRKLHTIIRDDERTFLDKETEKAFYRLHSYSTAGESYSRVVSVGPAWHQTQLAKGTPIYDIHGRFLGYFNRYDLLPRNNVLIIDGKRISVL